MKLASIFSFAFLATAVSAGSQCGMDKHPGILNAIGRFCQNQGIVVPSTYARNGVQGGYDGGRISIRGTCKPPQWVPQEYCMSQFKAMCSNTRKVRKFGRNGCQTWRIKYPQQIKSSGTKKMGAVPGPQQKKKPGKGPKSTRINL